MKLYRTKIKLSKVEFLNISNSFCQQAFKKSTIYSAWKKTGLISNKPACIIDKVCKGLPSLRSITLPPPTWLPLKKTSTSIKNMRELTFNQLSNIPMPKKIC